MSGAIPLRQAIEEYKSVYMSARNFAERTRVEYAYDIEELVSYLESTNVNRVGEVGVPNIERYLAELDRRSIAGTTRKRKVVSIRSFFAFLYQNGYITVNLGKRIIPPLVESKTPRFLTEAEYKCLLGACIHSSRDFALIQLLLQSGIKLSEISRLMINDVDLPSVLFPDTNTIGYVHIKGSERKKERTIPLNHKVCQALAIYLKRRPFTTTSALFLNRFKKQLSPRGVEKVVSKYYERSGIDNASVQSLRHTFGTHHAAKGTSVKTIQSVMGHKDLRSTSMYISLAREIADKKLLKNSL